VLGDTAYSAGEFRKHLEDNEMTAVIKPMPLRPAVDGATPSRTSRSTATPAPSPARTASR
jgi:hypothetical protein